MNFTFAVYLQGVDLREMVSEFFMHADITKMYCTAVLKMKDVTDSLYNYIKTGTEINIRFYDIDGDISDYYDNYFKVLSFNKSPRTTQKLEDMIDIDLISSWYFDADLASGVYYGTYGEIVNTVVSSKTRSYLVADITTTDDLSRYRYRTKESEQSFLQRMMKYGTKGNLPVYLYMDTRGYLKLRGVDDFIAEEATYAATVDTTELLELTPSNYDEYSKLRMTSYEVVSNASNSNSEVTTTISMDNFILPDTLTLTSNKVTLTDSEEDNDQCADPTPPINTFSGWNKTPDDAIALNVREFFDRNLTTYYILARFNGFLCYQLELGKMLKVFLPFNPVQSNYSTSEVNLGEGNYMVKHITYLYKDNYRSTRATLVQVDQTSQSLTTTS